jgi:hypothetical protein
VGKCGLASIAYSGKENISYNPENETVVKSINTLLSKPENNYASQAKRNDIA